MEVSLFDPFRLWRIRRQSGGTPDHFQDNLGVPRAQSGVVAPEVGRRRKDHPEGGRGVRQVRRLGDEEHWRESVRGPPYMTTVMFAIYGPSSWFTK